MSTSPKGDTTSVNLQAICVEQLLDQIVLLHPLKHHLDNVPLEVIYSIMMARTFQNTPQADQIIKTLQRVSAFHLEKVQSKTRCHRVCMAAVQMNYQTQLCSFRFDRSGDRKKDEEDEKNCRLDNMINIIQWKLGYSSTYLSHYWTLSLLLPALHSLRSGSNKQILVVVLSSDKHLHR